MPITINYESEAEWLKLRESDITSSEVAALFDESPYQTSYETWHRKKNGLVLAFEETDRIRWGRRYEAPTAEGLAEDNGWKVKPFKVYLRHDTVKRMGSSFDYEIEENGDAGILEIKCVDFKQYKEKWLVDGDVIEAPTHIELQLQHQLEVSDRNFGYIAAMIGGNKPIVVRRERDREIGKLICKKVTEFWDSIDQNIEPTPDFSRDGEIIKLIYSDVSGGEIDLTSNNQFPVLINDYAKFQQAEAEAKKAKDAAKTEMIMLMGAAGVARCGDAFVTRKQVTRKAYSVAESQYTDFRIKQPKGEKQ